MEKQDVSGSIHILVNFKATHISLVCSLFLYLLVQFSYPNIFPLSPVVSKRCVWPENIKRKRSRGQVCFPWCSPYVLAFKPHSLPELHRQVAHLIDRDGKKETDVLTCLQTILNAIMSCADYDCALINHIFSLLQQTVIIYYLCRQWMIFCYVQ